MKATVRLLAILSGLFLTAQCQAGPVLTTSPSPLPRIQSGGSVDIEIIALQLVGADPIAGWQTQLILVPQSGASGTARFTGAVAGTNYIFGAPSGFFNPSIFDTTTTGDSLLAFDIDPTPPFDPVDATGKGLMKVTVQAFGEGTYGLYALGAPNSIWTDASFNENPWDNIGSGGLVQIAEINVVPEPGSLLAWLGIAGSGWYLVRRRRTRSTA